MTLSEIKTAVDNGQKVYWKTLLYPVIKDSKGQYLIDCKGGMCIGLTWQDNVTLNGEESDFFIQPDTKIHTYLIGQRVTRDDVRGTVIGINTDRQTITVIWDDQTKATQYNSSDFPAIVPLSIQQMIDEVRANKFNKSERTTSESMFYAIKGNQIYLILRDVNYPFDLQKKLAFYQSLGYQTHVI